MNFHFQLRHHVGVAHNEEGFLHVNVDTHTDALGHSLITGTLGVREVESRLREAVHHTCDNIARDVEKAVAKGALIE